MQKKNGVLFKQKDGLDLLVTLKSMETEVIRRAHENGHFGMRKVYEAIQQQYFIPGMKEKTAKLIKSCIPCILAERNMASLKGSYTLFTKMIDHWKRSTSATKGR